MWWTGYNGIENEHEWVWNDNSPNDFADWAPGEPNNYRGIDEDCGILYHDGKWHDAPCEMKTNYVCKRKDSQGSNVALAILIPILLIILIAAAICICCYCKNKG